MASESFMLGPWLGVAVGTVVDELQKRGCVVDVVPEVLAGPLALVVSLGRAPSAQPGDHITAHTAYNQVVRFTVDTSARVPGELAVLSKQLAALKRQVNALKAPARGSRNK
jgi:hypothetical protein